MFAQIVMKSSATSFAILRPSRLGNGTFGVEDLRRGASIARAGWAALRPTVWVISPAAFTDHGYLVASISVDHASGNTTTANVNSVVNVAACTVRKMSINRPVAYSRPLNRNGFPRSPGRHQATFYGQLPGKKLASRERERRPLRWL
jgi:hypothetical protein